MPRENRESEAGLACGTRRVPPRPPLPSRCRAVALLAIRRCAGSSRTVSTRRPANPLPAKARCRRVLPRLPRPAGAPAADAADWRFAGVAARLRSIPLGSRSGRARLGGVSFRETTRKAIRQSEMLIGLPALLDAGHAHCSPGPPRTSFSQQRPSCERPPIRVPVLSAQRTAPGQVRLLLLASPGFQPVRARGEIPRGSRATLGSSIGLGVSPLRRRLPLFHSRGSALDLVRPAVRPGGKRGPAPRGLGAGPFSDL